MNRRRAAMFLNTLLLAIVMSPSAGALEKGTLIDAPGAKLYVEVRGSGSATPLIVVNGGPGFDHDYLHVSDAWDQLAKNRRVVFYDQRGNGRSPALEPGQSCTLADQIEDLDAVRRHLGVDKADFLGHSYGGYLVMAYGARHPEHVSKLVICDSAAPKWSDTKFIFSEIYPEISEEWEGLNFEDTLGDKDAAARTMELYFSMLFVSPEMRDLFASRAPEYDYSRPINEMLNADMARFDLEPELRDFDFPTLVITGRFDANVAPATAWEIHKAIPGSTFVAFEKSGHLPFLEEKELFVRTVETFLSGP